jgi:hypothetical protein
MSTAGASTSPPTPPKSNAAAMRSYRKRRRRGLRCYRVRIGHYDIDSLIVAGYLAPGDRKNNQAIQGAAESLIEDALEKFRVSGPTR